MQIHELTRLRRVDEGAGWDTIKTAMGGAVANATGQDQQTNAASAGILDPKQKLAAVMKEPQMVKLATQYAKEWLATQPKLVPEDTAVATPGTYNKRTGAAKMGGKTMTALSDLPPAVQQQIRAKQQELEKQTGQSNPNTAPTKPAAGTPTPNTVNATGFNYNNVMKMPGMEKYATPAAGTDTSAQTSPAAGGRINKADPNNPNIKDQTRYVQGRAGSGSGSNATKFAKFDPATSATANAAQGINNMVRGGVAAQQSAAPATATTTATPNYGTQTGAGAKVTYNQPTGVPNPLAKTSAATGTATNTTKVPPSDPADAEYLKDFLEFANKKIAIRDPSTYKMIGLSAVENSADKNNLRTELDAAKKKVMAAQGNPVATEEAVKNYILTAMAGAQLIASQNKVAAASPQAPAYGQQTPAPAAAGQSSNAAAAPAAGSLTGTGAVTLLKDVGLTAQILTTAGQKIRNATGNYELSSTGDSVIDTMLEGMGYNVS
jgi:hypothetical protein